MAAARQNEMKVSITVVATNTFTAGRRTFGMDEDIKKNAEQRKSMNLAQRAGSDPAGEGHPSHSRSETDEEFALFLQVKISIPNALGIPTLSGPHQSWPHPRFGGTAGCGMGAM